MSCQTTRSGAKQIRKPIVKSQNSLLSCKGIINFRIQFQKSYDFSNVRAFQIFRTQGFFIRLEQWRKFRTRHMHSFIR